MNGNHDTEADDADVASDADFKPARFSIELGLPTADESLLQDAHGGIVLRPTV